MRAGAADYIMKDRLGRLMPAIQRELREAEDRRQRRQAEVALRESEEKYRSLLEATEMGVGYYDVQGRLLLFNRQAAEYLGGRVEDFVGRTVLEIFGDAMGATVLERIAAAAQRDRPKTYEDRVLLPDGEHWFLSSYGAVKGHGGQVAGVQIVSNDITGLKRAEEGVRHERNLLHALMDGMPDRVYFKDAESRFIRVNRPHAEALGLQRPEDAIGKSDADLRPADRAAKMLAEEQEILRTRRPLTNVEREEGPDGTVHWSSVAKAPIIEEGRVVGLVGISRDITREMQLQQNMQQNFMS